MKTKAFVAFILVFLYGVALLKPALPLVDYYMRMEAYLEKCTNKSRPELHCDGQCVLMQKLKALDIDPQDPAPPAPVKVNLQEYPVTTIAQEETLTVIPAATPGTIFAPTSQATRQYQPEIFHPPATA